MGKELVDSGAPNEIELMTSADKEEFDVVSHAAADVDCSLRRSSCEDVLMCGESSLLMSLCSSWSGVSTAVFVASSDRWTRL